MILAVNMFAQKSKLAGIYKSVMGTHYGCNTLEFRGDTCYYFIDWLEEEQNWPDTLAVCHVKKLSKKLIELSSFNINTDRICEADYD